VTARTLLLLGKDIKRPTVPRRRDLGMRRSRRRRGGRLTSFFVIHITRGTTKKKESGHKGASPSHASPSSNPQTGAHWRNGTTATPITRTIRLNFDLAIPRRGLKRLGMGPLKRFVDMSVLLSRSRRLPSTSRVGGPRTTQKKSRQPSLLREEDLDVHEAR
jgi:hypothetical protein